MNIGFGTNKILYDNPNLQLKSAPSPDKKFDWIYAHRPNTEKKGDAIVIAPIIHKQYGDSLVFIETKRPPIQAEGKAESCIEFPAGLVGDIEKDETAKDAMRKELLEETGYAVDKYSISAKNITSSGGCTSETFTLAVADIYGRQAQEPVSDGDVIIKRHEIPVDEADEWLLEQSKQGKSLSGQMLAGMYFVKQHIDAKKA